MRVVRGRLGALFAFIGVLAVAIALFVVGDATAVTDAASPALTLPAASTANATNSRGAAVSFIAVATDDIQPTSVNCALASGSQFPIGTTNVTCTAADAAGHTTTASFTITVLGAADQLGLLRSAVIAAGLQRGTQASLLAQLDEAKRAIDGDKQKPACQLLTVFSDSLGDRDRSGADQSGVVADLLRRANEVRAALDCIPSVAPPVLLGPRADITAGTAPGASTATIRFTGPSSSVICAPTSPATLGIGTTRVSCTATNAAGSTTKSFLVTVVDLEAPVLTLPADIVVTAVPGSSSAVVTYVVSATDNVAIRSTVCVPSSGSAFPGGVTTVTCTATDTSGNATTGTFRVTVNFAISGRITDRATGMPLAGVRAAAVDPATRSLVNSAASGSDGNYLIVLPAGSYRVVFNPDVAVAYVREWWNGRPDFNSADVIGLAGSVGGIDASLVPGFFVHGQLTDEVTHIGIAGGFAAAKDATQPCCHFVASAAADANGNYTLVVPRGSLIKIQFSADPTLRYLSEWWDNKPDFNSATALTVSGEMFHIDGALAQGVLVGGRVTDDQTGAGIGGIGVSVTDSTTPCCPFRNISFVSTGADGTYSFLVPKGLPVKINFSPFGGTNASYIGEWFDNQPDWDRATVRSFNADTSGIDAALTRGFFIRGHVTRRDTGAPIEGLYVNANDGLAGCCRFIAGSRTDRNGDYAILVRAGTYKVLFFSRAPYLAADGATYIDQWWDGATNFEAGAQIVVNGDVSGINAVMTRAAVLSGHVTDATGTIPVAGFQVNALDATVQCCQFLGGAQTDALGNYSIGLPLGRIVKVDFGVFGGPPPGTRYLGQWWNNKSSFEAADPIVVDADRYGIDAHLGTGFLVSGHVSELSGGPLSGVQVQVIDSAVPCCPFREVAHTQTNATGDYVLVVPAGSYKVQFFEYPLPAHPHINQWWQGKPDEQRADLLAVTGDRPNIDAVLTPAVAISGRVTDATGAVAIAGLQVNALDAAVPCCQFFGGGQTDAQGNYSIAVPIGSSVKVDFGVFNGPPPGTRYLPQWWNNKPSFETADPIFAGADVPNIDAHLASGLVISGHVGELGGGPLSGVYVQVIDAAVPCCPFRQIAQTQTNTTGNYTLVIAGGSYKVQFFEYPLPAHPHMQQWWQGKPFDQVADVLVVTTDRPNIDAVLTPAVFIRGRVTDATGTVGIGGAFVSSPDATVPCCQFTAGSQTDALGNYFYVVPLGSLVKVQFGPPPGSPYIGQWWNNKATFDSADPISADADKIGIDARLATGSFVSGHVTDLAGQPLAGVVVNANDATLPCCQFLAAAETDALGNYRLVLSPGSRVRVFFIAPSNPRLMPEWWNDKPFFDVADIVDVTGSVSGIDARLRPGVLITGRVTDATGTIAVNGLNLSAQDASLPCCRFVAGTQTDALGNYTLFAPLGSSVKIEFGVFGGSPSGTTHYIGEWWNDKPSFETADPILAGADVSGIDVRLATGFVISGHVNDREGHSLPGVHVQVIDPAVPCCPFREVGHTQTSATGDYAVAVAAGTYKVQFFEYPLPADPHMNQWWQQKPNDAAADLLVVASDRAGIDAFLDAAKFVRGRVTDATGSIGVPGAFVSGLNASMQCCQFLGGNQTDPLGSYSFIVPRNTLVKVRFDPPAGLPYASEWWNDKSDFASADTLFMTTDQNGIDARLAAPAANSINGRVTDRATGLPIANIDVQAFNALVPCCTFFNGTRTNANGDYTLTLAGAATVKLIFQPPDPGPAYVARWWHDQPDFGPADQIVVNGTVMNIDQALDAGYRISGRVTDSANPGVGVPDVGVLAQPNFSCCFYGTRTGADGRYSVIVSAATYRISFFSPLGSDFLEQWWSGKPGYSAADLLTIPSSSVDLSRIDAALIHGIPVRGRVTDPTGIAGVDRVGVVATLDDPAVPCCVNYQAQTDADGNYTMYVLAGRYRINFQPPNTTDYVIEYWDDQPDFGSATLLDVSSPTFNIDARLERGFRISGRVTDATGGAAVPNSAVVISPEPCCQPPNVQFTGPDGTYSVVVRAGSYKIGFNAPFGTDFVGQFWNAKPNFVAADVLVVDAARPNIDAVLAHGVRLSGRVTEAADPSRGIGGVNVNVAMAADNLWIASTATSADGTYSIFVGPGSYVMYFSPPFGTDFLFEYWDDKPDFTTADVITVTGPPIANLDAALSRALTITGRVTSESGDPISGIIVNIDRSELPFTFVMSAITDSDGRYSAKVAAGSYKVFFFPGAGVPFIGEWWRDKTTFETAEVIDVSTSVPNVDGVLARGVLISGRVTVAGSGAALSGASVYVYDATKPCCVFVDVRGTGPDGTYSFTVAAGSYWVSFFATGYAEQWWDAKTSSLTADILSGAADHLNINAAMVPIGP